MVQRGYQFCLGDKPLESLAHNNFGTAGEVLKKNDKMIRVTGKSKPAARQGRKASGPCQARWPGCHQLIQYLNNLEGKK